MSFALITKPDHGAVLIEEGRASAALQRYLDDLEEAIQNHLLGDQVQLRTYTVATLPAATTAGGMIYVSDETGGAVPAFSDGTNWRRVTDRTVVA